MPKDNKSTIKVQGTAITIIPHKEDDFISLTDMVKNSDGGSALIEQWLNKKAPCGCKSVVAWAKHRMIPIR